MDSFQKKTLKVSRGYNYTYYVSTNTADPSLPAIFFTHGWPDDAHLWDKMSSYLLDLPFRLIAPDLLGYAGTDKPSAPDEYGWDKLSADEMDIIDAEKIDRVIAVGHDWGAVVAARLYNHHPDRVAGLAVLNVAYTPPSPETFDLDRTCEATAKIFGYPLFKYWYFFTDPSAPALLRSKIERLYAALHAEGTGSMKDFFTNTDAFPEFLGSDGELPALRPYAQDPAFKRCFVERLRRDGFEGAQQYYVASRYNHQSASDRAIPKDNYTVKVPFLFVGTDQDAVCRPELLDGVKKYLPDCTEVPLVHAGHWSPYEAPKEMATPIKDWLQKKFLKQQTH